MAGSDISGILLDPAPGASDLSREVLTAIFGANWWDPGQASEGSQAVFELLASLNAVGAVIIAWVMIIILLVSVVGAAKEGRGLGGQYHTPWVPLRLAFAMGAVAPIQNGLGALQLIILSIIGVSINLANNMQTTALNWLASESSLVAMNSASESHDYAITKGTLDVGDAVTGASKMSGKTLAVQILQTEAFLTYLHTQLGCDAPSENFAAQLTEVEDAATGNITLYFRNTGRLECQRGYIQKEPESFGGFTLIKSQANDVVVQVDMRKRVDLLKELIKNVEETGAPKHFAVMRFDGDTREAVTVVQDRAKVQAQGVIYANKLASLIRGRGQRSAQLDQKLALFRTNSENFGWFSLGAHYWSLATLEQELQAADDLAVAWIEPKFRNFADCLPVSFATSFWPRINEASYLGDKPSDDLWSKLWDYVSPFTGLSKRFAQALEASPDALLAMISLARWTSGTCSAILVAAEGAKLAAISGSKLMTKNAAMRVADFFTGGGEAGDSALQALIFDLTFFLRLIILPLWTFSTCVAYLMPAIPFLIWIAAIAGWIVLAVEAVIAAPLWLIGQAMPEGDGFAGSYGRSGYLLLLSVFLRPMLLVLSMFVCFIVMRATGSMIGTLMAPFIDSQADLSAITLGLVGSIFMFIVTCAAITLLTWKLFDLVTQMPDRLIRWMGQQVGGLGSESHIVHSLGAWQTATSSGQTLAHSASNTLKRGLNPVKSNLPMSNRIKNP
ncbi:MAG: DotA/TraY family protein [Desulfovibrionaceae bacterium]|nr:DotA/TraY family protein [Desulfovibrionaceae bacterium]